VKGHSVKGGKTHAYAQSRHKRPDTLNDFAQEPRSILETTTIVPGARVRTQEFVRKIAVAMFDVDEIKTCLAGHDGGAMKVCDDLSEISIA
jgi:hypothetical protein